MTKVVRGQSWIDRTWARSIIVIVLYEPIAQTDIYSHPIFFFTFLPLVDSDPTSSNSSVVFYLTRMFEPRKNIIHYK